MKKADMTNIFLSRPTWIEPEFRKGLDKFLYFLKNRGLKPKTLGVSYYGTKNPLDETISLMRKCKGAIILGYPQIRIREGVLKDTKISSKEAPGLILPTEWNHIEAALAHAKEIPLLLIHHINVKRGVFDKGATNSFIYEKDLADIDWSLSADIRGAIKVWKERVLKIPSVSEVHSDIVTAKIALDIDKQWQKKSRAIQILNPTDGAYVGNKPLVKVKSKKQNVKIWVIVHPKHLSEYWVQPEVSIERNGVWETQIYIGRAGSIDIGKQYNIIAVANPKKALKEGDVLDFWPESETYSQIVGVVRSREN